jgi:hypothetical protein
MKRTASGPSEKKKREGSQKRGILRKWDKEARMDMVDGAERIR